MTNHMNEATKELTKTEVQLAAAREVLAATGKSPRQLGQESRIKVINWIYRWGYSSSSIIQDLLGRTSAGYAHKLMKQGWLVATKTISGAPEVIFTLSELGLQEAERYSGDLYRYPDLDPYKVNQLQIRHYLLAQSTTINAINSGTIVDFETERMFSQVADAPRIKRPDIVWLTQSKRRFAIEIELSKKWDRDLDTFIFTILKALHSSKRKAARFDRFIVFTESPAIMNTYQQSMQPGSKLNIWRKNKRGHWFIARTIKVPSWLIGKVDFKLIKR